jgi:hypothetical protein
MSNSFNELYDMAEPLMKEGMHWTWMKWQTVVEPRVSWFLQWSSQQMYRIDWNKVPFQLIQIMTLFYMVWLTYSIVSVIDRVWFQPKEVQKKKTKEKPWEAPRRPITRSQTKATKFETQRRRHDRHEFSHGFYAY